MSKVQILSNLLKKLVKLNFVEYNGNYIVTSECHSLSLTKDEYELLKQIYEGVYKNDGNNENTEST